MKNTSSIPIEQFRNDSTTGNVAVALREIPRKKSVEEIREGDDHDDDDIIMVTITKILQKHESRLPQDHQPKQLRPTFDNDPTLLPIRT